MTNEHNCKAHKKEMRATLENPYHFLDSGLSNVYLVGIRYWLCDECNRQAAEIPALQGLMSAIATSVVMKPALLTGEEIRFLRKRIGKKASEFAELINKSPEHLSKLENDQVNLPEETDKLIRLTYGMLCGDQHLLTEIAAKAEEWLRSISNRANPDITFKKKANVWKPMAKGMAA
jgi:DNA-binding transcriptional regulator YiaG